MYIRTCNARVITLNHKNCDYDIIFIGLRNLPDWFLEISPLGKVPVLKVDDNEVLFESAVINKFIDDVTPWHFKAIRPTYFSEKPGLD